MDSDEVGMYAFIVYMVGCVIVFFFGTWWSYHNIIVPDTGPGPVAMLLASLLSFCACWLWPLALVVFPMYWMLG